MVKLKRLKILKYRNVRPGTELRFDDGFNLVLGKNASGKTALLSLLSMVCRSVFTEISDEEFALEYALTASGHTILAEVAHMRRPGGPEPRLWDDAYKIVVKSASGAATTYTNAPASTRDAHPPVPLIMEWSFIAAALSNEWSNPDATPTDRQGSFIELRNELLRVCGSTYRFDESLDCFAAMTGRDSALKGPAAPPQTYFRMRESRGIGTSEGAYLPLDLTGAVQDALKERTDTLSRDQPATPLSKALATALGVEHVEITPQVRERHHRGAEKSGLTSGFVFFIHQNGTETHHDRWSFGQKRLVGFFYYRALNPSIIIADELVNGLHHRWIEACMEEIGDRQAFLTSQNPLLFDYIPDFESAEQVQARFIICKTETVEGAEQLVWQNLSADEAETFFAAYRREVQPVGEILITRGLW